MSSNKGKRNGPGCSWDGETRRLLKRKNEEFRSMAIGFGVILIFVMIQIIF